MGVSGLGSGGVLGMEKEGSCESGRKEAQRKLDEAKRYVE